MIRLLKRLPSGDLELLSFEDEEDAPPYAILSHTWATNQEVTYGELVSGAGKDKTGYAKICFCVDRAAEGGLQHSWVDTCCIDKSSSSELSTAINSMFRWYQRAAKCYAYLADVRVPAEVADAQAFRITWERAFRRSRWFQRGWTLQELLAPPMVEFFSQEGKRLGSKILLEQEIHETTKIPIAVLRGQKLSESSIEERMSWMTNRTTALKEDKVYCLLGIFEVFLPLIYGEGETYAAGRLKEEIQKQQQGQGTEILQDLTVSPSLPFPRNELFTGREDQLQSLEQFLLPHNIHGRITICGLGGCGKSALAIEFAYRALTRHARHLVFWVPAISQESFELAYREIGIRLSVPGITDDNADATQLVKDALGSGTIGHWLMIVDNADDPRVLMGDARGNPGSARLYDYLPYSKRGKIIFTTRSRKAAGDMTPSSVLELNEISKEEAELLLVRRMSTPGLLQNNNTVSELLEILTYLPLAIVQAAAFMNNNDISVSGYISLLRNSGTETELFGEHFEDPGRYREVESTIAKTWHVSFDQIRRQDSLAAEYLAFMACIDRVNIPLSLLPAGGSLVQQAKAIGTLKGYAFITERQQASQEQESEKFFDMHRLVHLASEWWLNGHNEHTAWTAKAATRLEELIPLDGFDGMETWTSYLPHAIYLARSDGKLDELARAMLLNLVGGCEENLGRYSVAEMTHRQALLLREKMFGIEDELTLESMNELGKAFFNQGKFEEAEPTVRQTLAMREKILGPEHPHTLTSTNNLAALLYKQGKYEEAESIDRQNLAMREKVLGPEHPHTLTSANNLANVLYERGKHEEAESMNRQTLALREKVLGAEHPDTLTSANNLANVLYERGKHEEAESMNRQTLALREKVLGAEHPDTLTSANNLATVLYKRGKHEETKSIYRQTLALREKVLGAEHPDTLTSANNLAGVLYKRGKYEESESIYRQTLARREKLLGAEHPDTLRSMSNLVGWLKGQGEYDEAESLGRQTLARREKLLGAEHPETLRSMEQLAHVLAYRHRYDESAILHERACAGYSGDFGEDHPATRQCRQRYSGAFESV